MQNRYEIDHCLLSSPFIRHNGREYISLNWMFATLYKISIERNYLEKSWILKDYLINDMEDPDVCAYYQKASGRFFMRYFSLKCYETPRWFEHQYFYWKKYFTFWYLNLFYLGCRTTSLWVKNISFLFAVLSRDLNKKLR